MSESKSENDRRRRSSIDSTESEDVVENYIPRPPDGGWGWVIVAASLFCNIIVDGIGYSYGVLLPEFTRYFQEPRSKTSLIGSLQVGTYLCAGPIVSGLTNKFGCRPVTIAGSIVACLGFLIASFAGSVNILILTYGFLGGFGFGLIYLPAIVSVGFYFEKRRAMATGIAVCGSGVGTFIFSPVNSEMIAHMDWRNMLMIHAGIVLNGAVCGMLMRPLEPPKRKKRKVPDKSVIEKAKQEAIRNRQRAAESESSVADVQKFAKLREAKQQREDRLNEEDSDLSSLPSHIFIKGRQDSECQPYKHSFSDRGDSQPTSPVVDVPKIVLPTDETQPQVDETQANDSPRSNDSQNVPNESEKKQDDKEKEHMNGKNSLSVELPKGVFAHEVEPLIENGYSKNRSPKPNYSSAARLRIGSQHNIDKKDYARVMYRQDIFYSGSIVNLQEFKSSRQNVDQYITSITSIPGELGVPRASCWDHCTCLPKAVVDTLKDMLDVSLLRNFPFLMICLGNLTAMSGFYVPFSYLVDQSLLMGIDHTRAAFLLSVIGITNTVGRILAGIIADHTKLDALTINNVALVISSILLFFEPFCTEYWSLLVFASLYGLCVAAYISLTSIIICDILGLEKLTNAFGLLTFTRGVASIYGPPIAGMVFQMTKSYTASFYCGGGMFAIGAAFHLVLQVPCVRRWYQKPETEVVIDNVEMEPVV
ncbi:hypothetical protein FSP39_007911 [Pinctada imbricata]|uniref:Major facilitator superfamily (MFS) profile domain-containing protein n=1 Tax=Pinctada imbricata TaxID=66713 RepID=A0AA89CAM7_PINIB|nr:hypothetical protein FSP39_007911 [Pinctada imbricata]